MGSSVLQGALLQQNQVQLPVRMRSGHLVTRLHRVKKEKKKVTHPDVFSSWDGKTHRVKGYRKQMCKTKET